MSPPGPPPASSPPTYQRDPAVIVRRLPDRLVLLNGATGACFELNAVGGILWDRLARASTREELAAALVGSFALRPEDARADVTTFLAALEEARLVRVTAP